MDQSTSKSFCNKCQRQTNHQLLHKETIRSEEPEDNSHCKPIGWDDEYELLKCMGCESVTLKHSVFEDWNTGPNGELYPDVSFYPPLSARALPRWLHSPHGRSAFSGEALKFIPELIREIYSCLISKNLRCASMGIRCLIDGILHDRVGDIGSFSAKLKKMVQEDCITSKQKEILTMTIDQGSASMHRGYNPGIQSLYNALDIIESMIESIYLHAEQAEEIKKVTPKRQKQ